MKTHATQPKPIISMLALIVGLGLACRAVGLADSFQITGAVKDDLGNPVPEIEVTGDDFVGDVYSSKTDTDGNYAINLKAEGNYQVTVNCAQLTERDYGCVAPSAVTITSESVTRDFTVVSTLAPLQITNSFLPEGSAGTLYKTQFGAKGGRAPYKWRLRYESMEVSTDLALNSRGLLSGVPVTNRMITLNVQVTDTYSTVTNKIFSITINPGSLSSTPELAPTNLSVPAPSLNLQAR